MPVFAPIIRTFSEMYDFLNLCAPKLFHECPLVCVGCDFDCFQLPTSLQASRCCCTDSSQASQVNLRSRPVQEKVVLINAFDAAKYVYTLTDGI